MLTAEDARAKLEALRQDRGASEGGSVLGAPARSADYVTDQPPLLNGRELRLYRPLASHVDAIIRETQDAQRIYTGIEALDCEMRGIGRGHLCGIVGASHSGKSQLLMQILRHNKHRRVIFFVPDEPGTLILQKLTTLETGVSAVMLEQEIAARNAEYIELLRGVAEGDYPNLIVFDQPLDPQGMEAAYDEAVAVWGGEGPELICFDYVQLLRGYETVEQKFDYLKAFGVRKRCPMIALHQASRGAGKEGQEIGIDSGTYGGETHFTFMIGVRRKEAALAAERKELRQKELRGKGDPDRLSEIERDLAIHAYTVTINLVKNKRVGGKRVDDMDFELILDTGALVGPLDGLPRQYLERREREHVNGAARFARTQPPSTYSNTSHAQGEMEF